jgi:tRNA-dihydrouridine synthase C
MEGVTDAPMRALLTERGGFSYCVSEFFRISQDIPHERAFAEVFPELRHGSRTPSGTPVQPQLLGGDPGRMAESAARACRAGAVAIDLNFGCPAPTVNRNDGGATLLRHPRRIHEIVHAVRQAVPATIPVSAKLRLGWESIEDIHGNAEMALKGGASWLTIHGRTKAQSYRPPAYWEPIREVARNAGVPVIANGEIWTLDDFRRCREATGCEHFMLGRGAIADPMLALRIAAELGLARKYEPAALDWVALFERYNQLCAKLTPNPGYFLARSKQWLGMRAQRFPAPWITEARRAPNVEELMRIVKTG